MESKQRLTRSPAPSFCQAPLGSDVRRRIRNGWRDKNDSKTSTGRQ